MRPGGSHRVGQVDARLLAVPRRRARTRLGAPGRRRRARPGPAAPALRRRRGHPADRDPGRDPGGEHHALRRPCPAPRSSARSPSSASTVWVAGLPDGLDTLLGPGGTTLSAGEEQLVAFARLLVRDVRVVVLDEATARMDPVTEARVVRAAERLLAGRTGLLVAHRLSTTERAEQVAVLEGGRVVQHGPRGRLAAQPGPFRSLLEKAAEEDAPTPAPEAAVAGAERVGTARRAGQPLARRRLDDVPSLARATVSALLVEPRWGLVSVGLFLGAALSGAFGALTGWIWGHLVVALQNGDSPVVLTVALVVCLLASPLLLAEAFRRYPRWWIAVMLRVRSAVLARPDRAAPAGADAARRGRRPGHGRRPAGPLRRPLGRLRQRAGHRRGDRRSPAQSLLAGGVLLAVMVASSLASTLGRRVAGRSAAASAAARARFGRSLVSALDSVRTVKLAAATPSVHAAPQRGRRRPRRGGGPRAPGAGPARRRAHRDGAVRRRGGVGGPRHRRLGPGDRAARRRARSPGSTGSAGSPARSSPRRRAPAAWMQATSRLAGGGDLMALPAGRRPGAAARPRRRGPHPASRCAPWSWSASPRCTTTAPSASPTSTSPSAPASWCSCSGQVGSGKSSLLSVAGRAGRPARARSAGTARPSPTRRRSCGPAGSPTSPRCRGCCRAPSPTTSGWTTPTARCGRPLETRRLGPDVEAAGGPDALVGHRGVRLSGGQVQRLALARALACDAELLLADDVSSALDADTEIELWAALRAARRHRHRRDVQARGAGPGRPGRRAGGGPGRRRGGRGASSRGSWGHLAG